MGDTTTATRRSMRMRLIVIAWSAVCVAQTSAQDAAQPAAPAPAAAAQVEPAPIEQSAATEAPAEATAPASAPLERAAYSEARERVKRGEALFDAGNFDAALAEFEKAYELFVDHPLRPELLYNIALCHERSFRYRQAITFYERYLNEAGPEGESRVEVEAALRALSNLLAKIDVRSNVRAQVWVDDALAGEAPGVIMVPTGLHAIELRAPGYESEQRELRVTAREEASVSFELAKIDEGLRPAWFYSGLGATLVTAIVGTGFAAKLATDHADLEDREAAKNRPSDQKHLESLAMTADVFFATAGVLAVGTTILALFTDFGGDDPPQRSATALHVGPTGVSLRGAF